MTDLRFAMGVPAIVVSLSAAIACQSAASKPSESPEPPPPGAAAPTAQAPKPPPPPAEAEVAAAQGPDTARGGRLFDEWYADESFTGEFTPAKADAPGAGGPNGDGTLNDKSGRPIANSGHDYRLKNFFGWDLRGAAGVYGPVYQKSKTVLSTNLLEDQRSAEEIAAWLGTGDERLPAFGAVLSEGQLADIAAFVVAMRDHTLPQPSDIWELSKSAPKNYTLKPGADVAAGKAHISRTCVNCHGDDGTAMTIDDEYSMGQYARMKGYEIWLKILNGHPGSSMKPQVPAGTAAPEAAKLILDVLAATCDRQAFPKHGKSQDLPNGDARCGAYLK